MRTGSKLALAALAVTLAFTALTGAAGANRLSGNDRDIYFYWDEFTLRIAEFEVTCPVEMLSILHENNIVKRELSLIGLVTHAEAFEEECVGGTISFLEESLPWHILYKSFTGRLPNIESIRVLLDGISYDINIGRIACLGYDAGMMDSLDVILGITAGTVTSAVPDEEFQTSLRGGFFCSLNRAVPSGTADVERGEGQPYTIRLI
jgi:hypothetical protein